MQLFQNPDVRGNAARLLGTRGREHDGKPDFFWGGAGGPAGEVFTRSYTVEVDEAYVSNC